MPPSEQAVAAAKKRLPVVGRALAKTDASRDGLFAERLSLFQTLADADVKVAEIAALAGTSKENVRWALHKARMDRAEAGIIEDR